MTDSVQACLICQWDAEVKQSSDAIYLKCEKCGIFSFTRTLAATIRGLNLTDLNLLPFLRCYIRQANQRDEKPVLNTENWKDFARAHTLTPVWRKAEKVLEVVKDRTPHPGAMVEIKSWIDFPLVDAINEDELNYLLGYVVKENNLEGRHTAHIFEYRLTFKGWEHLKPMGGGKPGRCFIAMAFHPSMDEAYQNGIDLAVRECGLEPIRIDQVHHNGKICDKIIAEIRQCQFVVADFTLQRQGVYFEAGFAMGLGRPVIWLCKEDNFQETHFDTRQYNHIVWRNPQDLREKLADRIRATILDQAPPRIT